MEKDAQELVAQIKDNTKRMIAIGEAGKALIESILHNEDRIGGEGGMQDQCRKHLLLEQEDPKLHDELKDEYTTAVGFTMNQIAELYPLLQSMIAAFFRIPEDKKKFASKMN